MLVKSFNHGSGLTGWPEIVVKFLQDTLLSVEPSRLYKFYGEKARWRPSMIFMKLYNYISTALFFGIFLTATPGFPFNYNCINKQ